jgi:aromatic-L-amino-acid decarboxylase
VSEHPLELSGESMRSMVKLAMDRIVEHVRTLGEQPMHATRGGKKLARSLRQPMPERGVSFERLLAQLFGRIIPASLNTASPGYLAYIPGGGLFHSAVADLIADAVNRYVGVFVAAPGLVAIESNVIDWFCAMLGLPAGSGGVLTSGGSIANLIAVVTARREKLPDDFLRGVIYASTEAHHSVVKAAVIAGFPRERVREVAVDERFRISISSLCDAVTADRAQGLAPFLVVGNAGTTSTGAVDDLQALAEVAQRESLWLHVDAAYGGFFALTERGRAGLQGIERADSVTLDPHKSLFLPYGTGCIVVRDRGALRRTHATSASYMPRMQTDDDLVDFCELSPELSRDARGLRVWLPLMMHGATVFRAALDEKLDLAQLVVSELRKLAHVEIVAEPQLSLVAFRVRPPGLDDDALDAFNRRFLQRVNEKQRVLLTGVVIGSPRPRFVVRVCILSFRTHRDRIDACLDDIRASLQEE